jgi:hypothetical protein
VNVLNKRRVAAVAAMAAGAMLIPATASAGGGGGLLFNAQVNATAPPPPAGMVDNFPRNKQNEPTIALDPLTGALLAGSNDELDEPLCRTTSSGTGSCPFAPNVGNSGVYVSTTGGSSWAQPAYQESAAGVGSCQGRVIHTLPGYCEQSLESFGDPILSFGPAIGSDGKFSWANGSVAYYGNLAFAASGAGVPAMAVSRSADDAATWKAPVIVSSSSDNPVDFNDKDYVWADANAKSPFFGNVYASWTLFIGAGKFGKSNTFSPEPIVFARSTDGGQTWTSIQRLSQSANNGAVGGRQGSLIRTGPDGTVYVFWEGSIDRHSEQLLAVSHDGGVSFSRPLPVAAVNDIPSPLAGSSFRDDSFPSADVNQQTGALDVTWADQDLASSTALIKFTESTDGGLTWSAPIVIGGRAGAANAYFPSLAISPDGQHVFVGWPVQTWAAPGTAPGPGVVTDFAAFRVRSSGVWGTAQRLSTASGDPDGSSTNSLRSQFLGDYATAVASDSTGWFVWTDTRNDTACAAVDAFRAGTGPKPNPDTSCPPSTSGQLFGNSDIFVGAVGF